MLHYRSRNMNKEKLLRLERKIEARRVNIEAPIFLQRTEEGVVFGEAWLNRLGIPVGAFRPSKKTPTNRVLESGQYLTIEGDYAHLTNLDKSFIILDYETTDN